MSDTQRVVNPPMPLKDNGNGKSFQARIGRIGPMLGLTGLAAPSPSSRPASAPIPSIAIVSSELFYILSGNGEVRLDGRTLPLRPGDLIANPAGAEAHQIVNTGRDELRYLAISEIGSVDIIDYPDSGKMGAAAGVKNGDLSTATYKAFGRVTPADYFDGEEPATQPAARQAGSR
jgi:uncharacterized cupin superfamily protein